MKEDVIYNKAIICTICLFTLQTTLCFSLTQIIEYTKNEFVFKIINDNRLSSSRKRSPKSKTSQRFVFEARKILNQVQDDKIQFPYARKLVFPTHRVYAIRWTAEAYPLIEGGGYEKNFLLLLLSNPKKSNKA